MIFEILTKKKTKTDKLLLGIAGAAFIVAVISGFSGFTPGIIAGMTIWFVAQLAFFLKHVFSSKIDKKEVENLNHNLKSMNNSLIENDYEKFHNDSKDAFSNMQKMCEGIDLEFEKTIKLDKKEINNMTDLLEYIRRETEYEMKRSVNMDYTQDKDGEKFKNFLSDIESKLNIELKNKGLSKTKINLTTIRDNISNLITQKMNKKETIHPDTFKTLSENEKKLYQEKKDTLGNKFYEKKSLIERMTDLKNGKLNDAQKDILKNDINKTIKEISNYNLTEAIMTSVDKNLDGLSGANTTDNGREAVQNRLHNIVQAKINTKYNKNPGKYTKREIAKITEISNNNSLGK